MPEAAAAQVPGLLEIDQPGLRTTTDSEQLQILETRSMPDTAMAQAATP